MPGQQLCSALPQAEVALTVAESLSTKFPFINLASTYLRSVPEELCKLKHLTSINLSDNPIGELPESTCFPQQVSEINATACDLSTLPSSLPMLPKLKKLHAGTNSITTIDVIFECPSLQHAGLCYNRISSLPASLPVTSRIISLDLSHNDITDLSSSLHKLQLLPSLRILSLSGNPISLLPQYDAATKMAMKNLKFFDGIKLDALGPSANSRASTAASQQPAAPFISTAPGCDTHLRLEFTELQPSEDPFKEVRARYELMAAAPEGSEQPGTAGSIGPQPASSQLPLQPVEYHVELTDVDGTSYCSSCSLILQPPAPPVIEPTTKDSKQKAKPPPGKAEKVEPPPTPGPPRGSLSIRLGIQATVQWRNWLRKGIEMKIVCTKHISVARQLTEEEQEELKRAQTPPGKGAKGKGKEVQEPPPPPPFDVVTSQEVCGVAVIKCSALVTGHCTLYEAAAEFIPVPSLWDDRGIRMALADERHPSKPAARGRVKLQLHSDV